MTSLPPLSTLRAFEAAARHLSFTRAAEELAMTQAAVSYQVKLLEERLGVKLFHRSTRRVALTDTGRRLAAASTEAFTLLRSAVAGIAEASETVLAITALATFASNWLVPKLGNFQLLHPKYAVRLDTSVTAFDLGVAGFDIGVRTGAGKWPGCTAHFLFPEVYTPNCSPRLAAERNIRHPADLLTLPMIGEQDEWRRWFQAAGIADPPLPAVAHSLGVQQLEVTAAVAQNGIALGSPHFFHDDIESGRLAQPLDLASGPEGRAYWLVYRQDQQRSPKIRAFRDWVLDAAGRDLARAGNKSRGARPETSGSS